MRFGNTSLTGFGVASPRRNVVPVLACDFDGVIHTSSGGRHMGVLVDGARDHLHRLSIRGWDIVVHTTRAATDSGQDSVTHWLYENHMRYPVTATKPRADVYLDDHAIRFVDWPTAYTDIMYVSR